MMELKSGKSTDPAPNLEPRALSPSYRFWTSLFELDKLYKWDKGVYKDKLPDPRDKNKPEFMR
jgi:hypothetical protein